MLTLFLSFVEHAWRGHDMACNTVCWRRCMPAGTLQGINISSALTHCSSPNGLPMANWSKRAISYSMPSRDYYAPRGFRLRLVYVRSGKTGGLLGASCQQVNVSSHRFICISLLLYIASIERHAAIFSSRLRTYHYRHNYLIHLILVNTAPQH